MGLYWTNNPAALLCVATHAYFFQIRYFYWIRRATNRAPWFLKPACAWCTANKNTQNLNPDKLANYLKSYPIKKLKVKIITSVHQKCPNQIFFKNMMHCLVLQQCHVGKPIFRVTNCNWNINVLLIMLTLNTKLLRGITILKIILQASVNIIVL